MTTSTKTVAEMEAAIVYADTLSGLKTPAQIEAGVDLAATNSGLVATAQTTADAADGKAVAAQADATQALADAAKAESTAETAAGKLIKVLEADIKNSSVLVLSDSTGNATDEWVYLYGQWLAAQYPAYTVNYYLWNTGTDLYDSAVLLQTGTGANTVSIYNFAVSGGNPTGYQTAAGNAYGIRAASPADLIILNHGHNMALGFGISEADSKLVPYFHTALAEVLQYNEGAGVICLAQNPRRDDDQMQARYLATISYASLINASVADAYRLFIEQNKDSSLYNDNQHPSSAGTQLFLSSVTDLHRPKCPHKSALNALKDHAVSNLISNGDFLLFSGAEPDNWVSGGGAVVTKETGQIGSNGVYSVGVDDGYIEYTVPSTLHEAFKNRWLTLAVRMKQTGASTSESGRIAFITNEESLNINPANLAQYRFRWVFASIKTNDTLNSMTIRLYGDYAAAGAKCFFDKAVLVYGRIPKDLSPV